MAANAGSDAAGRNRHALAFLVAPLAPSLFVIALSLLNSGDGPTSRTLIVVLIPTLFVSYVATAMVGLPVLVLLRKALHVDVLRLATAGAVSGALVYYAVKLGLHWLGGASGFPPLTAQDLLFGLGFGGSVAFLYGVIAGYPLID